MGAQPYIGNREEKKKSRPVKEMLSTLSLANTWMVLRLLIGPCGGESREGKAQYAQQS